MLKTSNQPTRARKRRPGVPRTLPLLAAPPVARRVLMTYGTRLAIPESAAGVGATYFFRLNSPYDPDYTGVGTVAIPYNTWAAIYLNYKVNKVTMRAAATYGLGTTNTFANITLVPLAYQAVMPTNTTTWKMLPFAVNKAISLANNGGENIAHLTANWDLHKVARITKQQYDDEADWSGQVGSNPARVIFGGICFQPVGSAVAATMYCDINLTMEVEWFNPVPMQ